MIDPTALPHTFARAMETHDIENVSDWVHESYRQHNTYVPQGIPGVVFFMNACNTAFSNTNTL